jgi:protocatechuate 3,4-dioxygenase alpha subunit
MVQKLDYGKETPSQTAGPYVHIGLAPAAAGFRIFDGELGQVIAGPKSRASAFASRAGCSMAPAHRSRTC